MHTQSRLEAFMDQVLSRIMPLNWDVTVVMDRGQQPLASEQHVALSPISSGFDKKYLEINNDFLNFFFFLFLTPHSYIFN